jgi:hypothetical protein
MEELMTIVSIQALAVAVAIGLTTLVESVPFSQY